MFLVLFGTVSAVVVLDEFASVEEWRMAGACRGSGDTPAAVAIPIAEKLSQARFCRLLGLVGRGRDWNLYPVQNRAQEIPQNCW